MDSKEINLGKVRDIDTFFQVDYAETLASFIKNLSLVDDSQTIALQKEFTYRLELSLEAGVKYCVELQSRNEVKPHAVRDLKLFEWRILRDYKEYLVKTGQITIAQLKTKKSPDNPWASGQGFLFHELFSRQTLSVQDALKLAEKQKKKLTEKRITDLLTKYKADTFPMWSVEEGVGADGFYRFHLVKKEKV